MLRLLLVPTIAILGCAHPSPATTPTAEASAPDCGRAADTVVAVLHEDAEHAPPLRAVVERHCRDEAWTAAARTCIAAAADHDGALKCAYKHLTEEQHDLVVADMKALMPKPVATPEPVEEPPGSGSQAEIAAREAAEGTRLMTAGDYAKASAKFRDAVARVPEPRYFFDLCSSLYQEGKFGEALTACSAADRTNTSAELRPQIDALMRKIKDEAHRQGIQLQR